MIGGHDGVGEAGAGEQRAERRTGRSAGGRRDIVVVGASAGGVEALMQLVAGLEAGMHASIFVVLHMAEDARSSLANILGRAGTLPVVEARDGLAVRHGYVYVARPNYHLLLERGRVRVLAGPRENGARPAVDPLFRSAAWAYGERVVGVVLSGTLDDGTAGARVVRRHGGLVVAQADPLFTGMPQSVADNGRADRLLPVREIGPLLVGLAKLPAKLPAETEALTETRTATTPEGGETMTDMGGEGHERDGGRGGGRGGAGTQELREELLENQMEKAEGMASGFTCPECNGSLWERVETDSNGSEVQRYECRVDHKYTFETLVAAKAQEVEASVWAAINALEERASLLRKSASRALSRGLTTREVPERMLAQAREAEEHAESIRRTLLGSLSAVDGSGGGDGMDRNQPVGPVSP